MAGSNQTIEELFVEASQGVLDGRSTPSVTAEHPESAEQLAPMLDIVEALKNLSEPPFELAALARIGQRAEMTAQAKRLEASGRVSTAAASTPVQKLGDRGNVVAIGALERARTRIFGMSKRAALLTLAAAFVVVALTTFGIAALYGGSSQHATQQLESYTGVIARIDPDKWVLADNAEMVIDSLTEIHGQPAIGAKMVCIAERLPGNDRYRALEVWIVSAPGKSHIAPFPLRLASIVWGGAGAHGSVNN